MRVVVVEDEPELREALADYLPEHGLEPLFAPTGEEGIELVVKERPDAVVMDVRLPGISGFEACRELRAKGLTRDAPVVFLTARADQKDKLEGFEVGGVDYLTKPFQLEELVMRLRYHVDRARIDRELRLANEQLKLETERLERVLSITAHDLGGPLEGLALVIEMMRQSAEQRTEEALETLSSTVGSMRKLMDELLVWARTAPLGLEPVQRPVQVWSVAKRNLEVVKSLADSKGLRLEAKVSAHVWVHTDRNMLDTIVRNLVINAVKFTRDEGRVLIRARRLPGEVVIEVVDDGVGIPEARIPRLFGADRAESTEGTRGERGSGLGLGLAKQLAEVLGGRLEVSSELEVGSTFAVHLPDRARPRESGGDEVASGRR